MKCITASLDSIDVRYETSVINNKRKAPVRTSKILDKNTNNDSIMLINAHYDNSTKKNY